jgi:hypothetical protein
MTVVRNPRGGGLGVCIAEPRQKVQNFLFSGNDSGLSTFGKWRRNQQNRLDDRGEIARAIKLLPGRLTPDDLRTYLINLPCDLVTLRKFDLLAADFRRFEREGRRLAKWSAGRRAHG